MPDVQWTHNGTTITFKPRREGFLCLRCTAFVGDVATHTIWHDQVEGGRA